MSEITIGADISKDHIDLHRLPSGDRLRIANDRKVFATILDWLGDTPVARVVDKLTGAYHMGSFKLPASSTRTSVVWAWPSATRR